MNRAWVSVQNVVDGLKKELKTYLYKIIVTRVTTICYECISVIATKSENDPIVRCCSDRVANTSKVVVAGRVLESHRPVAIADAAVRLL